MQTKEIQNLIKEVLEKTRTISGDVVVTECVLDENLGGRCFAVEINNAHNFLAHEGEGLSALNHLVRRMIEAKMPKNEDETQKEIDILVDINGFQKKKIENLKSLVHMMAERARYFKSSIDLDPMSAYERRIVHELLSHATDLKTESDGMGHNRHIVIKYIGKEI